MIITLEIEDNVYDKIIYFLKHLKDDVKIINEIESISEKDPDYKLYLEAKEARKKGEKLYKMENILKDFE